MLQKHELNSSSAPRMSITGKEIKYSDGAKMVYLLLCIGIIILAVTRKIRVNIFNLKR